MRKKTSQIYVVHIITSLAADGAGTMLYRILAHTNRSHYYPVVISLDDDNGSADKIRAHGIPVHCLNMANSLTSGWHILRLVRLLRELEPDVIQGIITATNAQIEAVRDLVPTVIVLTSPIVRVYFKKLIDQFYPRVTVLSFNEIDTDIQIQALGNISL